MEFLVQIRIAIPSNMPNEERDRLKAAERRRGAQLRQEGSLQRIWRLPGQPASVSLYRVAGSTELHETLTSLPLWPWMTVKVTPLAAHPLEEQ